METFFSNLPTPIDIFINPISLVVYVIFGGLFIWESIFSARALPKIKFWKLRGLLFFIAYMLFSTYMPILWDDFLASFQLFNLNHLNLATQVVIGVFFYELMLYGWHISMHKSDFLFRTSHQLHHSSERIDVPSAFIFSVNDLIGLSFIGSISFTLIMGLSPQAATIIILTLTFLGIFQHANIRTPRWLGYIIQRPESHSLHHGKGIHKYNYSDLPIIDMVFGTFKNPKSFQNETGYYLGASNKIIDMLRYKDVTSPK
jgi:sterol desaturase/sphingolipid hydroxylase (fatty acid hydroxylase superfamily)